MLVWYKMYIRGSIYLCILKIHLYTYIYKKKTVNKLNQILFL